MKTEYEINAAINEAEMVSNPFAADNTPVAITQKTLSTLLDGAKGNIDKISELEDRLDRIIEATRG